MGEIVRYQGHVVEHRGREIAPVDIPVIRVDVPPPPQPRALPSRPAYAPGEGLGYLLEGWEPTPAPMDPPPARGALYPQRQYDVMRDPNRPGVGHETVNVGYRLDDDIPRAQPQATGYYEYRVRRTAGYSPAEIMIIFVAASTLLILAALVVLVAVAG